MRLSFSRIFLAAFSSFAMASTAMAALVPGPVNSIPLGGGKVLEIQGVVGSGTNTAYFALDYSMNSPAGPAYAWEYQWTGTKSESDMISDIAAADPSLTVVADPGFGASLIDNFNYGTNTGSANYNSVTNSLGNIYWASYYGPEDATAQAVNWTFAPLGNTGMQLGTKYDDSGNALSTEDGLVYGFTINDFAVNSFPNPNLPTVSVPEPATLGLGGAGIVLLLARRKRSHA